MREMRDLELIFDSEYHPYLNADLFTQREDYEKWLIVEKAALANIIRVQGKYVKSKAVPYPTEVPWENKSEHFWFKILVAKLFRYSVHRSAQNFYLVVCKSEVTSQLVVR